MKTLSKEQVLRLHNALLETFGGTAGVRDDGLLESALNAPFATFGGQYLYPSVQAKAAQLGFGLVCNHPFVDGNKRIGAHVMLVFLAINGIELDYTQEELIDIILQIASGRAKAADLLESTSCRMAVRHVGWLFSSALHFSYCRFPRSDSGVSMMESPYFWQSESERARTSV